MQNSGGGGKKLPLYYYYAPGRWCKLFDLIPDNKFSGVPN